MRVLLQKIFSFLKRIILSIRAVVSLHIGMSEDVEDQVQDTDQKGDSHDR